VVFRWPDLGAVSDNTTYLNAFNSSTTLNQPASVFELVGVLTPPGYDTNCFSSNQPGYNNTSLDTNWKA
jgi:hypothetical protein